MRGVLIVAVVLAAALGGTAVLANGAKGSAGACAGKRAKIGGKQVCLKPGARCVRRLDARYHLHGFHCHTGRLTGQQSKTPLMFPIEEVDGSGERGMATLTPIGPMETKVVIEIEGAPPEVVQPIHLHIGVCGVERNVTFDLGGVRSGRAESTIGPMGQVTSGRSSINIHTSPDDQKVVACGTIPPH